jgi:hypothetical protein
MNNTTAVYTPKIVKDLPPPIYRPPTVVHEHTSDPQTAVVNMYLTNVETEEGNTNWYLNIVDSSGQVFVYRLDVYYSK